MKLGSSITLVPVLYGRAAFGAYVRALCNTNRYDCIAVDIPQPFQEDLSEAIDGLPILSIITARQPERSHQTWYVPTDPCDAAIEGARQARQKRIPFHCIGYPELDTFPPLPPLPDEYAMQTMGFDAYTALCLHALGAMKSTPHRDRSAQFISHQLHRLRLTYKNILALVHLRSVTDTLSYFTQERTCNLTFPSMPPYQIQTFTANPDHLYFVLGELPFITALYEKERHDLFAAPMHIFDMIKNIFCETRDSYYNTREEITVLSPARIQSALTFVRNLTVMDNRFVPSLFDIIIAAKGVGGNTFALKILKSAKYYPYLPDCSARSMLSVGIDKVLFPDTSTPVQAVNLLRDTQMHWHLINLKPDPTEMCKKKYRYAWNPQGMCSHVPEDQRIEHFNDHVRTRALQRLCEDFTKTEPFETSIKDGIDIRDTLRNWHTGKIYVKEIPPSRGKVDTVIIIFDDMHDERYTHHTTWYAEHDEESTLTFYGTDPFENLIGPGIARCEYGGISLLFPPRNIPCIFDIEGIGQYKKLSHRLTYGALLFSQERSVAYVAAKRPDIIQKQCASKLKKQLLWIPLTTFSTETIRRLRRFHVLNGKAVRTWANRFIEE